MRAGSIDQWKTEERSDILVHSTDPLADGVEVSGPVEVTLFVSTNARDTNCSVKALDVHPAGRACNLAKRSSDGSVGVAALNAVHHGRHAPSRITLTVVPWPR